MVTMPLCALRVRSVMMIRATQPTQAVLALDLEGTLISNAMSQFPRTGLHAFLVSSAELFGKNNIVIYTTVSQTLFRDIANRLYDEGHVPEWFTTIRYIEWAGQIKDLRCVSADIEKVLLVDDFEGYIEPQQKHRWVEMTPYIHPYHDDDALDKLTKTLIERRFTDF